VRYCFRCESCGEGWEETRHCGDDVTRGSCPSCGGSGRRDYRAEHTLDRSGEHGMWPMVSEAAGISPCDIPATEARLERMGAKCRFDGLGRPIFTDMAHRRRVLKAMGLVDRNSYI
jgi:hypothetical protein